MWIVKLRNFKISLIYKYLLKPIFFSQDPEDVHDNMTNMGIRLGKYSITRKLSSWMFWYSNSMLEQDILGIHFKNPIGLAAGFDKDANLTQILPSIGFGFEEVGSITGEKCEGNPKPRLWRLKDSRSLLVYYGLKNQGCEFLAQKLSKLKFEFPIGTSVAKTNCQETVEVEAGVQDYLKAFTTLKDIGDYNTINISCPNAFGGQPFTDPVSLEKLLSLTDNVVTKKPTFIKLSPDLKNDEVDKILEVLSHHKISGIICGNLTKNRENKLLIDKDIPNVGGVGGKAVQELSDNQIKYIYSKTRGKYILVGCGGISCGADAYKKIRLGASLLQLITGMIYEGPQVISQINLELVEFLKRDGFKNISEAVGVDNR